MILIADGGSTKVDWIALSDDKNELFRVRTLGLNPAVIPQDELNNRIINMYQLINVKEEVKKIYFYGAGCGTPKPVAVLKSVMENIFTNAEVHIAEDMLAAVYAVAGDTPAMVCILGTGSNSCYFDGKEMHMNTPSLGYIVMDEASGNYFGKLLLRDYFYGIMPDRIAKSFQEQYNIEADEIKYNLYKEPNPNMYLATFAKFMFEFKDEKYIKKLIRKGFKEFFKYRILTYQNVTQETPIYFIGSIAHYFSDILEKVANKYGHTITGIIQRPINNLIEYHQKNIK